LKEFSRKVPGLKLFLKFQVFVFFLIHRSRQKLGFIFENGGLLAYSSVPKLLILVFDARRIPPRRAGACNTLKEPAGGLWGILNESKISFFE
jgi:hypothetical protein